MTSEPDQILSEFIDAWNAGRRPRAAEYLARAPDAEREALADDIARFVAMAPEPAYGPESLAQIRAEAAPPLPALLARSRERARVTLRDVARALGVADEPKAERYLRELEAGSLNPHGVSRRVFDVLARTLGLSGEQLEAAAVRMSAPAAPAAPALWRAQPEAAQQERADLENLARALEAPAPEPWDEVDQLFRGGR